MPPIEAAARSPTIVLSGQMAVLTVSHSLGDVKVFGDVVIWDILFARDVTMFVSSVSSNNPTTVGGGSGRRRAATNRIDGRVRGRLLRAFGN